MPPLLVLRDPVASELLAGRLRAVGWPALAAPCLVFEAVSADDALLAPLRAAPADLLVTTPRSLPALLAAGIPDAWRVLALAPSTSRALLAAGLRVDVAVEGGGAALVTAARPGPVVLATSDLGGEDVLAARPDAVVWVTHVTRPPACLPADAVAALTADYELLAGSPSALRHLDQLLPGAVARCARALCHGASTADTARALGAPVVTPVRLTDAPPWLVVEPTP